jgi:hypothetical protein
MSNPSSFSSISFETETAKEFKKTCKILGKTHSQFLVDLLHEIQLGKTIEEELEEWRKNERKKQNE